MTELIRKSEDSATSKDSVADELVSLIYDTAFEPQLWPQLLETIGDALGQDMLFALRAGNQAESSDSHPLQWLTPHFERAIQMGGKIYQMQAEHSAFKNFLNRVPFGVIIVQSNGDIVASNKKADGLIDSSELLSIENNTLDFHSSPTHTTKLKRAIRQVALGTFSEENDTAFSTIRMTSRNQSVSLHVTPIQNISGDIAQDFVAVLIAGVEGNNRQSANAICKSHGLSKAESKLVGALLDGCNTLPEAAKELGVSIHTVRSQIKSVFAKMEVANQAELLKKILTSSEFLLPTEEKTLTNSSTSKGQPKEHPYRLLKLMDGRYLEYTEYGSPDGIPLLFLHSAIFSRKTLHPNSNFVDRNGIRVIAPQRPGFGKSEMPGNTSLTAYARDIKQLMTHLDIDRFYLVAEGDGGPFAIAASLSLQDRIERMSLIATLAPPKFEKLETMVSLDRLMHGLNKVAPLFAIHMMRMAIRGLKKNPENYFNKIYAEIYESDQKVVDSPEHKEMWREILDSITPQNIDAFIENYLARLSPWDFDIEKVSVPTDIWHGVEDRRTPVAFARKLAEVIPENRAFILEDQGHYLFFTHWDQILETLFSAKDSGS